MDTPLRQGARTRDRPTWTPRPLAESYIGRSLADGRFMIRQPIAEARGLKVTVTDSQGRPVDLCGCPVRVDGAQPQATCPPELGQHTDAILREAGLTQEQITRLREGGIV